MASRVLLVGPPYCFRGICHSCMAQAPFEVQLLSSSVQALASARREPPAAVVIYVDGNGEGLALCRDLRGLGAFPVIAASDDHRSDLAIRVLEAGADDFVSLAITPRELRARIRAHIRRALQYAQAQQTILRLGDIEIDRGRREVRAGDGLACLAPKEFALLEYLATKPDRVIRREELLREIWNLPAGIRSRTLDVHLSRLRQKLHQAHVPVTISTVAGVGYRLSLS